ncbi:helix-turn-helix transcriptional regulator [Citrobacter werkmanii]|uniref:helix-turn-helix transcriptional regulator n=1 Tax=Citrobacter werkmanii TaxID=67827 RepID=UPI0026550514|nr:helix-turn-helix transcriptional regulator [Citrobacter werkmanii]MDN8558656.1 helix-turn-helix transcriptional regulator [Citrobacter werkmanii]
MVNNDYPLNTLNQLRPLLIGFRKANGLTQKELSDRLGVAQQTYARLEANPATASIERLFKVFSVLGVKISFSSATIFSERTSTEEILTLNSPARQEKW